MMRETYTSGIELRLVTDQSGTVYVLPRALLDQVRVPEEYQDAARDVMAGGDPSLVHAFSAIRPASPSSSAFLSAVTRLQSAAMRAAQSRAAPEEDHTGDASLLQLLGDAVPISSLR